jgi:hypothetical protein
MGGGTDNGGNPRTMNEREYQHFNKYGGVIGVTDVTKRTSSDDSHCGGIHHLDIPMLAERSNDPPPNDIGGKENGKTDGGKHGIKRTMQENHFESGADQYAGVQQDHRTKNGINYPGGSVGHHFALVTPGNLEFVNAQQGYDKQEPEIGFDA